MQLSGPVEGFLAFPVSILTGPEGPVQPCRPSAFGVYCPFQSSPVPRDRCNRGRAAPSIRMRFHPHRSRGTGATFGGAQSRGRNLVSILTGPEGPVQPAGRSSRASSSCFNPHRSRGTGATQALAASPGKHGWFQSSPVPRDRCNAALVRRRNAVNVSILTGPEGPVQRSLLRAEAELFRTQNPAMADNSESVIQFSQLSMCSPLH